MKSVSASLLVFLAALMALAACAGEMPGSATEGVVTSPPSAQTEAGPPPDPTAILRDFGPGSQAEQDLDWRTLTGIATAETKGFIIHLAQGNSASGQGHLLLAVIEPETEAEGWRPSSALVSPIETAGPTFLTVTTPTDLVYLGFIGAESPAVIGYDGEDGSVRSVGVNSSEGITLLPDARKSDPRPRLQLAASEAPPSMQSTEAAGSEVLHIGGGSLASQVVDRLEADGSRVERLSTIPAPRKLNSRVIVVFDGGWLAHRVDDAQLHGLMRRALGSGAAVVVIGEATSRLYEALDRAEVRKLWVTETGVVRNPAHFNPPQAGFRLKDSGDGGRYPSHLGSNTTDPDALAEALVNWLRDA